MNSQTKQIEKFLKQGRAITPMLALRLFGCFRLAARINDLKEMGLAIESKMVSKDGKRFARYELAK